MKSMPSTPELLGNRKKNHANGTFKIAVFGGARVGKTCLISQFLRTGFVPCYKPTVEDLFRREFKTDMGMTLTVEILDTAGDYQFPAMRKLEIQRSHAFVLVFAIDDKDSFQKVEELREEILQEKEGDVPPQIVVVGNKADRDTHRHVSREEADTIVSLDWEHRYIETSAKSNVNIDAVFEQVLRTF